MCVCVLGAGVRGAQWNGNAATGGIVKHSDVWWTKLVCVWENVCVGGGGGVC